MTFAQYLKNVEGFISFKQYKAFLEQLPEEGRKKVRTYYETRYEDHERTKQQLQQIDLLRRSQINIR